MGCDVGGVTGFAASGVVVVVAEDDGGFFFFSFAVPGRVALGPVVLGPVVLGPLVPGLVVAVPAGPGLPPGCCVAGLESVPRLGVAPALPGVTAALEGVSGRTGTTGAPGWAAMTPGPLSWPGCAVAATEG